MKPKDRVRILSGQHAGAIATIVLVCGNDAMVRLVCGQLILIGLGDCLKLEERQ